MPSPFPNLPPAQRGRVERIIVQSELLEDNYWNDPHERECYVYLPKDYQPGSSIPVILFLAGNCASH